MDKLWTHLDGIILSVDGATHHGTAKHVEKHFLKKMKKVFDIDFQP